MVATSRLRFDSSLKGIYGVRFFLKKNLVGVARVWFGGFLDLSNNMFVWLVVGFL
jgi:hypothetical protein